MEPYPPQFNQYNPADYAPPPNNGPLPTAGYTPPPQQPAHHEYGNPYAPEPRNRRPNDNVSAPYIPEHTTRGGSRLSPAHEHMRADSQSLADGLSRPHAPSPVSVQPTKSVQFDLNTQEQSPERHHSPNRDYPPERRDRDREKRDDRRRGDRDDRGRHRERNSKSNGRRRDDSADSAASDATIELPPRFDDQGRRKGDDPIADKLESVLASLFR